MKHIKWQWIVKGVFFGALAVVVFVGGTMLLWNNLATAIFGLPPITFLQTIGLMFLGRLLTGGFGGRGFGGGRRFGPGFAGRRYMRERWQNMSEDERRQFMQRWGRHGCGPADEREDAGPESAQTTA